MDLMRLELMIDSTILGFDKDWRSRYSSPKMTDAPKIRTPKKSSDPLGRKIAE
jgi:hypothetical protein